MNFCKQLWLIFLMSFSLVTLSGCLTVGDEFTSEVSWIEKDRTTRKDVEAKFGSPFRTGYDTGLLTYTYAFYRYSVFRPARTKDLTVRFNSTGTVNSYSFASSFDEDKAKALK
jgi:hypothetical protein